MVRWYIRVYMYGILRGYVCITSWLGSRIYRGYVGMGYGRELCPNDTYLARYPNPVVQCLGTLVLTVHSLRDKTALR